MEVIQKINYYETMHDVLIKNGTIIDGSGNPRFKADIAFSDGTITKIGNLQGESSQIEIDAAGHYVTPGFIDISNRSDVYWRLFVDPTVESLLRQGITTIIGGNSGSSLAPIYNKHMFRSTQKWSDISKVNINWQSTEEFLDVIDRHHLSVNFGTLVGHGTLRRGLIGDEMRALNNSEMVVMEQYVRTALEGGALGLSLGLGYVHGKHISREELRMLGEVVADCGGYVAAHVRDEGKGLVDAVDEVLTLAETSQVKAHITHLKAVGESNWPLMKKAMERIDLSRMHGSHITFDVYPYTMTGSVLYTFYQSGSLMVVRK